MKNHRLRRGLWRHTIANPSADPATEFTKMWAMKESYLKMIGVGITQSLSNIDTTKLDNKINTFMNCGSYIAIASSESFREESICLN